ncbi:MAG: hypothetical protein WCB44_20365, partial [Stellaceae bacterium]
MAKVELGTCHICGKYGKLSFDHVPPEAAFNDHRVLRISFEQVSVGQHPDNLRGRYQQRGAGASTLCVKCNSDTGHWYGTAYADWAAQAMRILLGTSGRPSLEYPFRLFPLRVLKQVVCMFFSINSPLFHTRQPDLVRFVRCLSGLHPRALDLVIDFVGTLAHWTLARLSPLHFGCCHEPVYS